MPVINLADVPVKTGSAYPGNFSEAMKGRSSQKLASAGKLTQFGANLVYLEPGAMSSLRHYHMQQDGFVMITQGASTLADDHGQHIMQPGDCAAFPVIGTHTQSETAYYSDIDMMVRAKGGGFAYTHKDGTPYEGEKT